MQLKQGTLLQGGKYKIEKVLGQGNFGITYLAIVQNLKDKVIIKEFHLRSINDLDTHGGANSLIDLCKKNSLEKVHYYKS